MTQTMSTLLYKMQMYCTHQDPKKLNVSTDAIIDITCKQYKVTLPMMQEKTRRRRILRPRQIACYLLRKYTYLTLEEMGDMFNQHYSTIINALNTIDSQYKLYEEVRMEIRLLESKIRTDNEE